MNKLRQVLTTFEEQPMSLSELAKYLDVSETMAHDMILYWVHKGKLRQAEDGCTACKKHCQVKDLGIPRYELVTVGSEDAAGITPYPCCSA